jgi:hypothetical protein
MPVMAVTAPRHLRNKTSSAQKALVESTGPCGGDAMATHAVKRLLDLELLLEQWHHAVDHQYIETFASLYAHDACLYVPLAPEPLKGRKAIQQHEGAMYAAFPGAHLILRSSIFGGDSVAVEWDYTGKNTGPLIGPTGQVSPTNRVATIHGASFLRFGPDGLIAEEHRYYDSRSLMQQLGLL